MEEEEMEEEEEDENDKREIENQLMVLRRDFLDKPTWIIFCSMSGRLMYPSMLFSTSPIIVLYTAGKQRALV